MTNDEAREAAARIAYRLEYLGSAPDCPHIWNGHDYCQWCRSSRLYIDAFALAQHYLELTKKGEK